MIIIIGKEKSLNKKKTGLSMSEVFEKFKGSASTTLSSTLSKLNPRIALPIAISLALLTSTDILITNEKLSKIKTHYTKIRD